MLKISFLFIIFLMGCAVSPSQNMNSSKDIKETPLPIQETVRPGEVKKIEFIQRNVSGPVQCKDRQIPLISHDNHHTAFVAETYFTQFKPFHCSIQKNGKVVKLVDFKVVSKDFPSEKLNVDKKRVTLSPRDLKRVRKEQKFLNKVYASSPARPLFNENFLAPLHSKITSIYGSRRLYNNHKQGQHLGTDFRAAIGTPIQTSNAGKVVVARDLFFTGNTVTIDHGLGMFTIYGHLNKISVVEGEYVPRGTIIGEAGMTGRVTGPHLHWGVKVNGHFIDGFSLVEQTQKLSFRDDL